MPPLLTSSLVPSDSNRRSSHNIPMTKDRESSPADHNNNDVLHRRTTSSNSHHHDSENNNSSSSISSYHGYYGSPLPRPAPPRLALYDPNTSINSSNASNAVDDTNNVARAQAEARPQPGLLSRRHTAPPGQYYYNPQQQQQFCPQQQKQQQLPGQNSGQQCYRYQQQQQQQQQQQHQQQPSFQTTAYSPNNYNRQYSQPARLDEITTYDYPSSSSFHVERSLEEIQRRTIQTTYGEPFQQDTIVDPRQPSFSSSSLLSSSDQEVTSSTASSPAISKPSLSNVLSKLLPGRRRRRSGQWDRGGEDFLTHDNDNSNNGGDDDHDDGCQYEYEDGIDEEGGEIISLDDDDDDVDYSIEYDDDDDDDQEENEVFLPEDDDAEVHYDHSRMDGDEKEVSTTAEYPPPMAEDAYYYDHRIMQNDDHDDRRSGVTTMTSTGYLQSRSSVSSQNSVVSPVGTTTMMMPPSQQQVSSNSVEKIVKIFDPSINNHNNVSFENMIPGCSTQSSSSAATFHPVPPLQQQQRQQQRQQGNAEKKLTTFFDQNTSPFRTPPHNDIPFKKPYDNTISHHEGHSTIPVVEATTANAIPVAEDAADDDIAASFFGRPLSEMELCEKESDAFLPSVRGDGNTNFNVGAGHVAQDSVVQGHFEGFRCDAASDVSDDDDDIAESFFGRPLSEMESCEKEADAFLPSIRRDGNFNDTGTGGHVAQNTVAQGYFEGFQHNNTSGDVSDADDDADDIAESFFGRPLMEMETREKETDATLPSIRRDNLSDTGAWAHVTQQLPTATQGSRYNTVDCDVVADDNIVKSLFGRPLMEMKSCEKRADAFLPSVRRYISSYTRGHAAQDPAGMQGCKDAQCHTANADIGADVDTDAADDIAEAFFGRPLMEMETCEKEMDAMLPTIRMDSTNDSMGSQAVQSPVAMQGFSNGPHYSAPAASGSTMEPSGIYNGAGGDNVSQTTMPAAVSPKEGEPPPVVREGYVRQLGQFLWRSVRTIFTFSADNPTTNNSSDMRV